MAYPKRLEGVLTAQEKRLFKRLNTPQKIQDYLDTLPINFETKGETYMSPRRMIKAQTAHCFEGSLFAAAVLAYHGHKPLLLDIRTIPKDEDHVVTLFKQGGRWGAISKTNHAILRFRDPVYESVRELAMSYYHEFIMDDGTKSMLAYSAPYDLSKWPIEKWFIAEDELFWLVEALDRSRHFPVAPKKNLKLMRKAKKPELHALKTVEWKSQGKRAKL